MSQSHRENQHGTGQSPGAPQVPSGEVAPGLVWPPIEGRQLLRKLAGEATVLERNPAGDWHSSAGPWQVYSAAAGEYPDFEQGHRALLAWAHWHSGLGRQLSPGRCITLGEAPEGGTRLWQMVHRDPPLRPWVAKVLRTADPETIARTMLRVAEALQEVHDELAPAGLRITLDNVGLLDSRPTYVALAPSPRGLEQRPAGFVPRALDLAEVFRPAIMRELSVASPIRLAVADQLEQIGRVVGQPGAGKQLASLLEAANRPARP